MSKNKPFKIPTMINLLQGNQEWNLVHRLRSFERKSPLLDFSKKSVSKANQPGKVRNLCTSDQGEI